MAHGRSPTHVRRRRGRSAPDPGPAGPRRLQKLLAAAGIASRRNAEELIRAGRVRVNGREAGLGDSADPARDVIELDGERLRIEPPRYWVLHKPVGVVTSVRDPHGRDTVMQLLPEGLGRVYPVGRLDRDSSGLLLVTNDGDLAHRLLHPSYKSEKEYRVTVRGELGERELGRLARGIRLEDGKTAPARVSALRFDSDSGTTSLTLTLIEGRKRQIRRMMLALGHPVKKLVRTRVGPLKLGRLEPGASRALRPDEIRALESHARGLAPKRRGRRLRPSRRSGAAAGRRPAADRA